jgi:hypothetical protein
MAGGEQQLSVRSAFAAGVVALTLTASPAVAQAGQLLLDQGRQVAGLWVFPQLGTPDRFVYLPSTARIALDAAGRPQFSFVFYTSRPATDASTPATPDLSSITTAEGGAIVHFLIEYFTPPEQVAEAETELKRALHNTNVRITGATVFDDGQYVVVSSSAVGDRVQPELLAIKKAPVLEGNRLAISLRLSAEDAAVLLETFRTATPDLSVTFDMGFSGLTEAYDAEMMVNWEKVKEAYDASAGATIYVVGLKAEAAVESLFQKGAITLRQSGHDEPSEALVAAAHARILDLLFAPIEVEKVPEAQRGGLLEALSMMFTSGSGPAASGKTVGFGITAAFQYKLLRSTGTTRLDFATRSRVSRRALLTVNAGDLYRRFGSDSRFFRTADLTGDLQHSLRQVFVTVDGALAPEFTQFVNNVQVTVRKRHQGGAQTTRELVVTRANAAATGPLGPMTYAALGDTVPDAWRRYEYRTRWSFYGGFSYETPWRETDEAVIVLAAPFHRQVVRLEGDAADLRAKNVRAVDVKISNQLFDNTRTVRRSATVSATAPLSLPEVELVLPEGSDQYEYEVTWTLRSGSRRVFSGTSESGSFFFDNDL